LVTRWEKVRRLGQPDRTLGQHVLLRGTLAHLLHYLYHVDDIIIFFKNTAYFLESFCEKEF